MGCFSSRSSRCCCGQVRAGPCHVNSNWDERMDGAGAARCVFQLEGGVKENGLTSLGQSYCLVTLMAVGCAVSLSSRWK